MPTGAIIGAGPLGRWLALEAARAGFSVLLEDVMPWNLHHAQEALRSVLGPDPLHRFHLPVAVVGGQRTAGQPGTACSLLGAEVPLWQS